MPAVESEAYLIPTWLMQEQRLPQVKINRSINQSSGRSDRMPCLNRRLGFVPGAVEVAAVHLGHQGAPKLLSIPKATQPREVCSDIGDDNSQVCVQVTLWVPAYVKNSGESKRFFTANTKKGVITFTLAAQHASTTI